ncbi:MAG: PAS domain S-box protein [Caldilinea sp. CFX5]|nr:PAS domain S-box protein [Caldilinea sp. CFX5]
MSQVQCTVLIVAAVQEDRIAIHRALHQDPSVNYRLLEAESGAQALACLRQEQPDCLLLAYDLPDMDGLLLLQMIVQQAAPYIYPVVMLCDASRATLVVQTLQQGAHDFLLKEAMTAEQVQWAIRNAREKVALQRQIEEQREWFRLTLASIGDGVIATDQAGGVNFMNSAEAALARYQLLAEQTHDIILFVRLDGQIIDANRAATASYGYDRATLLTKTIFDLRAPDTLADVQAQMAQASTHEVRFETRHRRADGSTFPVEVRSCGADIGGERHLLSIVRDITERKETEERLRQNELRFRRMADTMPALALTSDAEGRLTFANHRWLDYTGMTLAETLTLGAWPVIHPADVARDRALWEAALATGQPYLSEYRLRRHDGVYRWHLERAEPERNAAGQVVQWIHNAIDIEDRKELEERLRHSEAQLNTILYHIPASIYILSTDHRYLLVNRVYEHNNNITNAELRGQSVYDRWPREVADALVANERQVLAAKAPITLEEAALRNGKMHYFSSIKAPLLDEAGEPYAIIGISLDITDRKAAEEEVKRSRNFLLRIAQVLPAALYVYDLPSQSFIFNNQPPQPIFNLGGNAQPIAQVEIDDLLHPDDRERTLQEFQRLYTAADGEVVETVFRQRNAAGEYRWWQDRTVVFARDEQGQVIQHLGIGSDITEHKQAEADTYFLVNLAETIRSTDNANELLTAVTDQVGEYLAVGRAYFTQQDLTQDRGWIPHQYSPTLPPVATTYGLSTYQSPLRPALEGGQTLVCHDAQTDPRTQAVYATLYAPAQERAFIDVPLLRAGQLVATLSVTVPAARHWQPREVHLLETVAERVWLAVEKLRLAAELRQNEERLRLALAAANAGGWSYDLQQNVAHWSPEMFALYGLSAAAGAPALAAFAQWIHPDDRAQANAEMAAAVRGGGAFAIEFRVQLPDGRERWINSSGLVELDCDGRPLTARGIDQDISRRKQAELALQQSNAILKGVLESSNDAIFVRDLSGRYLLVNHTGAEQVQSSQAALIGQRYEDLFAPAEVAAIRADDRPVLEQGQSVTVEHTTHHQGITRYWHTLKMPLRNSEGAIIGLISSARDITDRKRQEEAVHQVNLHLEQRVAERTRELEEKNVELERSNKELEKFAYVASHDLRSPLRAIDNLSKWIEEDAGHLLPASSKEHLAKMRGRVRRMEKLLDDLLDYSRIGRFHYQLERLSVKQVVQESLALLNLPPAFQVTIVEPLPVFWAQRIPLELVLRNLISNAIKHHHRPDGHVQVAAYEEGAWLHFTVSDDGPGIDPQFHDRIFDIFQTLKPRDQVEGSGMGLAIVKKAIELVGGTITVDSSVGAGATFHFTWPKGAQAAKKADTAIS